jgi:hypothetical protein
VPDDYKQARVEVAADRRCQRRALGAPVLHEAWPGEVQMVLRGDGDIERLHPRQMFGPTDECMLDRPSSPSNRSLLIGGFVRLQNEVDSGVANGMCRHAPTAAIELAHGVDELGGINRLQSTIGSLLIKRRLIQITHQAAFKAAVDHEFDAAQSKPLIAFIQSHPGFVQRARWPGHCPPSAGARESACAVSRGAAFPVALDSAQWECRGVVPW